MTDTTINVAVTDAGGTKFTASAIATVADIWPSAATTGCGSTVLTPAPTNNISAPGTYTGLLFTGYVTVNTNNAVFKNCKFTVPASAPYNIEVNAGFTGILFDHCTIIGAGSAGPLGAYGIYIKGNSAVTIQWCDIGQCGQSVAINNGQIQILNNWMHDLNSGSGTHYECIYYGGAGGATFSMLIQGNHMENLNNQTAAVYLENYFGVLKNVTVDRNLLIGGSYTVYAEGNQKPNDVLNIKITNNALGKGYYGYINANKGLAPNYAVVVSGNYDWVTSAPVVAIQDNH